jgi:hypothetical protein
MPSPLAAAKTWDASPGLEANSQTVRSLNARPAPSSAARLAEPRARTEVRADGWWQQPRAEGSSPKAQEEAALHCLRHWRRSCWCHERWRIGGYQHEGHSERSVGVVARNKPTRRKPEVPATDNSLKGLRRAARAEEHDGVLPAPSLVIAAPGTSRRITDKKRRTQAGHGK